MYTTIGGIGQDFLKIEKEMEYYTSKIYKLEKRVEVNNVYD